MQKGPNRGEPDISQFARREIPEGMHLVLIEEASEINETRAKKRGIELRRPEVILHVHAAEPSEDKLGELLDM